MATMQHKSINNKHILTQETESKTQETRMIKHIQIEGWLFKKSRVLKKWRKRWMVIAGNTIYSYKNERKYNEEPTEKIHIRNILSIQKHSNKKSHTFDIELDKKLIFTLSADTNTYRDIWINEINKLINLNSSMIITKQSINGRILSFGCKHFRRNCSYLCSCCNKWYFCSYCHDEIESTIIDGHHLQRGNIIAIKCCNCGKEQKPNISCIKCNILMGYYYCEICRFWDNDTNHLLFHCDKCGVCLNKQFFKIHKCVEQSTKCDCPICGDYMHCSNQPVTFWTKCGHAIHCQCMEEYLVYDTLCPICREPWVP
eukprot:753252_1